MPTGVVRIHNPSSETFTNDFPTLLSGLHPFFAIHGALDQFHKHLENPRHLTVYSRLATIAYLWEELSTYPSEKERLAQLQVNPPIHARQNDADVDPDVSVIDDDADDKASAKADTSVQRDSDAGAAGSVSSNTRSARKRARLSTE